LQQLKKCRCSRNTYYFIYHNFKPSKLLKMFTTVNTYVWKNYYIFLKKKQYRHVLSIWCLWDRASLQLRCKQPTRCNKFRLLIILNQLYMVWTTKSSIHWSTFWLYIKSKCSWGWASVSPETCRADLKRPINGICCILLVAYIVRLKHFNHQTSQNSTTD